MAGKTQFTERFTVNLTKEQAAGFYRLMARKGLSKQDALMDALKVMVETHGIEWPEDKLPRVRTRGQEAE